MKKLIRIFALLLAFCAFFLLGWRVMPKVWPSIKTNVVYRILPQMQPTPAPIVTPAPYVPESNAALSDDFLPGDSVIYYFYKDYCPYCAQLEPLMAGLPKSITLPSGEKSDVRLVCLNKNDPEAAEVIAAYYADYAIAEEEQYVPAVVIGEKYLMPGREIIDMLMDALMEGEGLNSPDLKNAASADE